MILRNAPSLIGCLHLRKFFRITEITKEKISRFERIKAIVKIMIHTN